MVDAQVRPTHWVSLRRASNCFIPRLTKAVIANDLSATQIRYSAREPGLSLQVVGKVLTCKPVVHQKAQQVLRAYRVLRSGAPKLPEIHDEDIVCAVFRIPELASLRQTIGWSVEQLSEAAGVSRATIRYAEAGGPVTAGITGALQAALPDAPPLDLFCSSRPPSVTPVEPLEFEDLMIPNPRRDMVWP